MNCWNYHNLFLNKNPKVMPSLINMGTFSLFLRFGCLKHNYFTKEKSPTYSDWVINGCCWIESVEKKCISLNYEGKSLLKINLVNEKIFVHYLMLYTFFYLFTSNWIVYILLLLILIWKEDSIQSFLCEILQNLIDNFKLLYIKSDVMLPFKWFFKL